MQYFSHAGGTSCPIGLITLGQLYLFNNTCLGSEAEQVTADTGRGFYWSCILNPRAGGVGSLADTLSNVTINIVRTH